MKTITTYSELINEVKNQIVANYRLYANDYEDTFEASTFATVSFNGIKINIMYDSGCSDVASGWQIDVQSKSQDVRDILEDALHFKVCNDDTAKRLYWSRQPEVKLFADYDVLAELMKLTVRA